MTATQSLSIHTIGAELERDRLELRAGRVRLVIAALRLRASEQPRELDAPPRHLRRALADFEAQLDAMNARIRDLAPRRESGRL